MSGLRVAAIQHEIAWNDRSTNFERLSARIGEAAAQRADLVLVTETFSTGFGFDDPEFEAEPTGGPSSQFLADEATTNGIWVGGSCPEIHPDAPADDQRPSNCFVLVDPDGNEHRYRKIHPFSHAGEERYVRAGTELVTVDVDGVSCSLFVCYDLRFADEFWQLAPQTDAYLVVANWPEKRRAHWMTLLRARAIENQAYVVGVNRIGEGGGLRYSGDSQIIDPLGDVLVAASGVETILTADIDTETVASTRSHFRFLQDRR